MTSFLAKSMHWLSRKDSRPRMTQCCNKNTKPRSQFQILIHAITFQSPGMFLSASGTRTVALKTVNVSEVQLTIDRVYRNNLFFFFDRNSGGYENEDYYDSTVSQVFGDRLVTETISLSNERNKSVITPLALTVTSKKKPQAYIVSVSSVLILHAALRAGCCSPT